MMAEADKSKDGKIAWHEFLDIMIGQGQQALTEFMEETQASVHGQVSKSHSLNKTKSIPDTPGATTKKTISDNAHIVTSPSRKMSADNVEEEKVRHATEVTTIRTVSVKTESVAKVSDSIRNPIVSDAAEVEAKIISIQPREGQDLVT